MTAISRTQWLEALASSVTDVAATMGFDATLLPANDPDYGPTAGSYLSLKSETNAIEIGLLSSADGCRSLAAMLLSMEPDEAAALENSDIADGVGELVNVLVGVLKTAVAQTDTQLQLGLPIFVAGSMIPGRHMSRDTIVCELGGTQCSIELHVATHGR
jgi:hypothetical protein